MQTWDMSGFVGIALAYGFSRWKEKQGIPQERAMANTVLQEDWEVTTHGEPPICVWSC